eukprot:SAG31_NODE_3743_length_3930_cov_6.026103_2_plen_130_part_00
MEASQSGVISWGIHPFDNAQRLAVDGEHRSPVQLHALPEHVTLIARQSVENGLPVAIDGSCLLIGHQAPGCNAVQAQSNFMATFAFDALNEEHESGDAEVLASNNLLATYVTERCPNVVSTINKENIDP